MSKRMNINVCSLSHAHIRLWFQPTSIPKYLIPYGAAAFESTDCRYPYAVQIAPNNWPIEESKNKQMNEEA